MRKVCVRGRKAESLSTPYWEGGGLILVVRTVSVILIIGIGFPHRLLPLLAPLDEIDKRCRFLSPLDKRVLEQLLGRGSFVRILLEAMGDEILELLGEVALQCRRTILRDEEEHAHWMKIGIRWLALGHFYGRNAQRPNVGLGVIAGLLDNFGGHPEGGAHECVALRHLISQLASHAKVGQLYRARARQ